ncbi:Integration host factor, alpha subunit [Candidatus Jidaibacter acanthamoeba]|uniref:Histone-like DNA-binding protein n=2 Tax=Candidatus Jidaibacter acanthamoebae TaxID=86105 RepID=A0A0C1QX52_9RICK|nr:Integration host factor, alpha subunit [Candidatus Jidaibacter acanthamoeba]
MKVNKMISCLNKSTITREFLARAIKRESGINITKSSEMVDQLINFLISRICEDYEIKIRLFGSFISKSKKERLGRNPKTMEEATIPARKVVKFKVAPKLKKRINDNIHLIS